MRSQAEVDAVLALIVRGMNDCQIALRTGVPARTVNDWRRGAAAGLEAPGRLARRPWKARCLVCAGRRTDLRELEYAYLLGMYLGDGCLSKTARPGVHRLRVTLDSDYSGIVTACVAAMEAVSTGKHAHVMGRPGRCVEVSTYWKHWICHFPQHGPGKKHERRIRLSAWQFSIVGPKA